MLYLGEHDYINVNGSSARAILKSEEDVCDNKLNSKKSEHYSNNSNNTRTLTQQSSLVAPSEVHVSISPALTAKPVLTPNGMCAIKNSKQKRNRTQKKNNFTIYTDRTTETPG